MKVKVMADVCFDSLQALKLQTQHDNTVLTLTSSELAEHVADNQVLL